jgi:hypothetical protein
MRQALAPRRREEVEAARTDQLALRVALLVQVQAVVQRTAQTSARRAAAEAGAAWQDESAARLRIEPR